VRPRSRQFPGTRDEDQSSGLGDRRYESEWKGVPIPAHPGAPYTMAWHFDEPSDPSAVPTSSCRRARRRVTCASRGGGVRASEGTGGIVKRVRRWYGTCAERGAEALLATAGAFPDEVRVPSRSACAPSSERVRMAAHVLRERDVDLRRRVEAAALGASLKNTPGGLRGEVGAGGMLRAIRPLGLHVAVQYTASRRTWRTEFSRRWTAPAWRTGSRSGFRSWTSSRRIQAHLLLHQVAWEEESAS